MRIALTLFCVVLVGCGHHTQTANPVAPLEGLTLQQMQAQWNRMYAQYAADCINGSPEHVNGNQALCAQERDQMAPLGKLIELRRTELQAQR